MPDLLRLYCLGQFQLERNGQPLALLTRKTEALLAYLVLHPEVHTREKLATLFWGNFVDTEARQSLRTALSALRKTLNEACLFADRTTVQFNPNYPLWTDAVVFRTQGQRFLSQPLPDPSLVDLTLYWGDFLGGFYEDWILREREELRRLHRELDDAIRDAYGWDDIDLEHDFYEVDTLAENDRVRYTISPDARKELLRRLLLLNHERAADEEADAKPAQKKGAGKSKKVADKRQPTLI